MYMYLYTYIYVYSIHNVKIYTHSAPSSAGSSGNTTVACERRINI